MQWVSRAMGNDQFMEVAKSPYFLHYWYKNYGELFMKKHQMVY